MKLLLLLILVNVINASMIQRTRVVMGTFVSIKMYENNKQYIEKSFSIIENIDNKLSTFKENSTISKLNINKKVKLDKITYEALVLSKKYYKDTNTYFNITIGSITKDLYNFGDEQKIPSSQDIYDAKVNLDALEFNQSRAVLKDGFKVDLGGMGKGFGVDKIAEYLKIYDINEAIISASGDIRCLSTCRIDVKNPFKADVLLSFETKKNNLGITTSGNYNRFVKDTTHNHLINPKTKLSAQNFASITLVGEMKSSALDAYATAISVMPKDEAYRFLDSLEVGYIVVEVNGKSVVKSSDFFDLVLNVK